MRTYDYICSNGHVLEVVHGVHEAGPTACPRCGAPLRKLISASAIHYRGTGWAKKDARAASAARSGKGARHGSHEKAGGGDAGAGRRDAGAGRGDAGPGGGAAGAAQPDRDGGKGSPAAGGEE